MSKFVKAERKRVKLKIALTGPSGAGKTFSALELASGLGQKIALIDTENDSASLYSDRFTFDSLVIDPPYTIQKYVEAIRAAQEEKYDVLVIDSISHAWAGDGGLLSKKEAMDARGGNQFANWGTITKEQEQFKAMLLNADIHTICTMRSKQEYAQVEEGGRKKIQKLGMAPIQRDGMEYEFTAVLDVAMDHKAQASKDRTGLFDGQIFQITKQTGEKLISWLNGAKVEAAPRPEAPVAPVTPIRAVESAQEADGVRKVTEKQLKRLYAIQNKSGCPIEQVKAWIEEMGVKSSKDLDFVQYDRLVKKVEAFKAPALSEETIPY
jgi:hypothetical protein